MYIRMLCIYIVVLFQLSVHVCKYVGLTIKLYVMLNLARFAV